ncbi:hypothetical protein [Phascolarctobacterium succinatutens]
MQKINKINYIVYYCIFYILYIIIPTMKDGTSLETWEAYFPVKLLPAFLALLWEELHRDIKEMLFYRKRGDFAKLRSLKKVYTRRAISILVFGSIILAFILFYFFVFIKNISGIDLFFLICN